MSGQMLIELPVTLTDLSVAVFRVPYPMSERDYDALVASLASWKESLVKEDDPPGDALSPAPRREP